MSRLATRLPLEQHTLSCYALIKKNMAPAKKRNVCSKTTSANTAKKAKIDPSLQVQQIIDSRKNANDVFDVLECLQVCVFVRSVSIQLRQTTPTILMIHASLNTALYVICSVDITLTTDYRLYYSQRKKRKSYLPSMHAAIYLLLFWREKTCSLGNSLMKKQC